ncbi:2-oxo acid dehydrogenase subunit E2 [Bradyrhizobium manausense]|uniref:dihydrolipoamide acetyltransferase family protein n=1 Tax=Bradyrhizobium manausense TaxID=989370 RepID=UPI001BADA279|nr:dihydrolipoamide acetyltransferase family protein [Bradyrhizobium manausense]MBR0828622.1 2-oxo acid dehydrogenase subunit E2 [Bradyrhizobium manausense]
MGRYLFRLPDVGEGIAEAEIVAWHVSVGDVVAEDQNLVDVMTDKATVEVMSPVSGKVTATHGEVGGMAPVGSVLIELDIEGAGNADEKTVAAAPAIGTGLATVGDVEPSSARTLTTTAPASAAKSETPKPVEFAKTTERPKAAAVWTMRAAGQEPLASPATRRRAHELGIPLQYVPGTGPGGRITAEDLDAFIASGGIALAGDARYVAREGIADVKIIGLRRKIAEKMQEAKRRIPHINYVEECDVTELEALRADVNSHRSPDQPKLTLLPFFMRALVRALPDFPQVNARYDDDAGLLHTYEGVHIGVATQTPGGLMVPVIRNAEQYDLWGLAAELARVAAAARDGSATRDELSGSTITLTSLGTLGGIVSTPVINHPEVAILAPNKIVERPVLNGPFVSVRKMMNLSSSFDHRIIDGYDAAQFVQRMKRLIEHPALIFMD